jgi:hypothetical protein
MAETKASKEWRYRNLEKERERGRQKYRRKAGTKAGLIDNLWRGAKQRATKKDLAFDLTKEWIADRLKENTCAVTGIQFSYEVVGAFRFYGATIDRIKPDLGYTQSNCQIVIWGYNAAKGNATHADVMQLAKTLIANDNKRPSSTNRL